MAKDKEYRRLIHTTRWLRLRQRVLTEHPLCQRCESEGRITSACEVHHIHPVEEAFTYEERKQRMYDPNNLLALCHECHVKTHTDMGRSGKEATLKRNKKQADEIYKKLFGDD